MNELENQVFKMLKFSISTDMEIFGSLQDDTIQSIKKQGFELSDFIK